MKYLRIFLLLWISLAITVNVDAQKKRSSSSQDQVSSFVKSFEHYPGFIDFYWDRKTDQVYLFVEELDTEIIYVNSLAAGVGSNDIGLDRGQLGDTRIVRFDRHGPKILLTEPNYYFRASSSNPAELKAVEDAFATSVLWGFKIEKENEKGVLINITDFILRDAHGVVRRLSGMKQGNFSLDKSRSAVYEDRTKNFPDNTEFENILTFKGTATGRYIRSVVPTPGSVTVRQHHSFVRLPDDKYTPRLHDPRAGFFGPSYHDFATPIDEPIEKKLIARHRLKKKNPNAEKSEAVEPIVYYLDPGTPEPVRSALLDGARWWNQAFEAAGYIDAFQVKMLPEDADPLDVRYNVIQWVHRSTRGWSYGSSVTDPRTGEIIKGHVSLGSLRVRQDFLIAEGLLSPYSSDQVSDEMLKMALARIRQLSAHEVGHTLGLAHSYASSSNERASVMDYPHPYVQLTNGKIDLSDAYDTKIGEWDKIAIRYGYSDFGNEDKNKLNDILLEAHRKGLIFISDRDARARGGAHPTAHLWDNGSSATTELSRVLEVRRVALNSFSLGNIKDGEPYSNLEDRLVPIYLFHRYQTEAAVKVIGGELYTYGAKGQPEFINEIVPPDEQKKALKVVLKTISSGELSLPNKIIELIPPPAFGYSRTTESFDHRTGLTFDPISVAESAAEMSVGLLMNHQRLNRLVEQNAINSDNLGLEEFLDIVFSATWKTESGEGLQKQIKMTVDQIILNNLFQAYASKSLSPGARQAIFTKLMSLKAWLKSNSEDDHYAYGFYQIDQFLLDPLEFRVDEAPDLPAGSPIGQDNCSYRYN